MSKQNNLIKNVIDIKVIYEVQYILLSENITQNYWIQEQYIFENCLELFMILWTTFPFMEVIYENKSFLRRSLV